MRALYFAVILITACLTASASELQLVLLNGSVTDLAVDAGPGQSSIEVLPGASAAVAFRNPQWVNFGQLARQYNIAPLQALAAKSESPLVLQAQPNGRLYLVPPGTIKPLSAMPKQPKGLPLRATRVIDLT